MTAKDIVGKKICWNDGLWIRYLPNGQITNYLNPKPHSRWSVPEPGVVKLGNRFGQVQALPDGRLYFDYFCGRCGSITGHYEKWGTVCN